MQPESSPAAAPQRLHYLDWLRVGIVMVLVYLAHSILPFSAGTWVINSTQQLPLAANVVLLIGNQFAMPVMFFISGVSVAFALRRRTSGRLVRERFWRLLVPWALLTVTLSPPQGYLGALNHGTYQGAFLPFLPVFFSPSSYPGASLPQYIAAISYQLWFLVFLFAYSLLGLPLFQALRGERGRVWIGRLAGATRWRGGSLLFALPLVLVLVLFLPVFPGYQNWADFLFKFVYFILGFVIFSDERLVASVRRDGSWALAAFVVSLVIFILLSVRLIVNLEELISIDAAGQLSLRLPSWLPPLVMALIAVNSWALSLFVLYIGMRFMDFTGPRLAYLGEASMPFYLLHHPILVVIAFFVVQWPVGAWGQWLLLAVSGYVITLGLYHLFIRHLNPLRTVTGLSPLQPQQRAALRPARLDLQRGLFLAGLAIFAAAIVAVSR